MGMKDGEEKNPIQLNFLSVIHPIMFPLDRNSRQWERRGVGGGRGGEERGGRIVEKQRKVTQHSGASGSSTSIATITSTITSALTSIITSTIISSVISPITSLLFTDSLRAPPSLLAAGPILSTLLNFYFLPVSLKVKLMKKSAFPHGRADRFVQKLETMLFEKMYCMTASFRLHCTLRISAERQLKYVKTSAYAQTLEPFTRVLDLCKSLKCPAAAPSELRMF